MCGTCFSRSLPRLDRLVSGEAHRRLEVLVRVGDASGPSRASSVAERAARRPLERVHEYRRRGQLHVAPEHDVDRHAPVLMEKRVRSGPEEPAAQPRDQDTLHLVRFRYPVLYVHRQPRSAAPGRSPVMPKSSVKFSTTTGPTPRCSDLDKLTNSLGLSERSPRCGLGAIKAQNRCLRTAEPFERSLPMGCVMRDAARCAATPLLRAAVSRWRCGTRLETGLG